MKAYFYDTYGPPDVLKLKEMAVPEPKENEILVRVRAASVNPLDWHRMRGEPFLFRLMEGLIKPKTNTLGADIAGLVEVVGQEVRDFNPGDAVFGDIGVGAFAEVACGDQAKFALKPANLTFEAAAATPIVGLTALQCLRDHGWVQAGQSVLVNGASGGVGTFTVQIAKSFGAEVTGVCSTRNLEMVHSIGADHVIDYTQVDFTRNGCQYDLIIDAVGNRSVADYKRALNPQGICVVAGFTSLGLILQLALLGSWENKFGSRKIKTMLAKMGQEDLMFLKELMESGKLVPVIDRSYPFSELPEAIRYLEGGRARGKVVISM
jgi:NADPH:quinone reductase-like Zn-dependent oxidoreductase